MNFGRVVGTACATFAITNIDDIFVLVTFFAEATTNVNLTSLQITAGQYVGFTIITIISMIGFGASLLFPSEPIGFLGLMPLLLGVWWLLGLLFPVQEAEPEAPTGLLDSEPPTTDNANVEANVETKPPAWRRWAKSIGKVSSITVMNGADNIGTYVPLFSQAKGAEIAVYVVIYYILLGVWCAAAFLIMKQKHVLGLAQKYAIMVVPFLYLGLGIFILVKSECYPWSVEQIDDDLPQTHPGTIIMAVVTAGLLLACISAMLWFRLHKWLPARRQARAIRPGTEPVALELGAVGPQDPVSSAGPAQALGGGSEIVPAMEIVSYQPVVGSHPTTASSTSWRLPHWPKRVRINSQRFFIYLSSLMTLYTGAVEDLRGRSGGNRAGRSWRNDFRMETRSMRPACVRPS